MRAFALSLLLGACLTAIGSTGRAAEPDDGSQLIYGNYCGKGQRGVNPKPIDALDAACARHDACTPDVGMPACGCHARLRREARQAAYQPGTSDYTRNTALFISEFITMLPCTDERIAGHP